MSLGLVFIAGLALSGHCLLMCGVFPAALGAAAGGGRRAIVRQLLYGAGKTSTYAFLGILAGLAGARLDPLQRPLGLVAGGMLLAIGVVTVVPRATAPRLAAWVAASPACSLLATLVSRPSLATAFSAGVFNGFVPCGLVYALLAFCATLGSPGIAALTMASFGLGTLPVLFAAGMGASWMAPWMPHLPAGVRVSGAATMALGLLSLWRALSGEGHLQHALSQLGR